MDKVVVFFKFNLWLPRDAKSSHEIYWFYIHKFLKKFNFRTQACVNGIFSKIQSSEPTPLTLPSFQGKP